MKITWLGQAGLLFETGGKRIIVDPYLSDSVEKINPKNKRRMPIDNSYLKIRPDVLILTHNHLDHADPDTLPHYLNNDGEILVLASGCAWQEVRKYGGNHNYVMFNRHTHFTYDDIEFRAVKAEHSDEHAIGVIMHAEGKNYYITGDTLYNDEIFGDINCGIDAVFLPINGVGNNMNITDAARFAEKINAKKAVPVHWGLFDSLDPNSFSFAKKVIPSIYKEVIL